VRPVRRRNARSELSAAAVAKSRKSSRRENHARAHPTMREKKSIEPVVSRSTVSRFIGRVGQSERSKKPRFCSYVVGRNKNAFLLEKPRRAQRGAQRTTC
jgi:hypothetical protein